MWCAPQLWIIMQHVFYCNCDFKKNTLFSHYCYFYFLFQRITWNPLEAHRDLCLLKGKSEVSRRCEAMVWKLPDMHHVWLLVTTTEATVGWCCVILLTFTGVTTNIWQFEKHNHLNFDWPISKSNSDQIKTFYDIFGYVWLNSFCF